MYTRLLWLLADLAVAVFLYVINKADKNFVVLHRPLH